MNEPEQNSPSTRTLMLGPDGAVYGIPVGTGRAFPVPAELGSEITLPSATVRTPPRRPNSGGCISYLPAATLRTPPRRPTAGGCISY